MFATNGQAWNEPLVYMLNFPTIQLFDLSIVVRYAWWVIIFHFVFPSFDTHFLNPTLLTDCHHISMDLIGQQNEVDQSNPWCLVTIMTISREFCLLNNQLFFLLIKWTQVTNSSISLVNVLTKQAQKPYLQKICLY